MVKFPMKSQTQGHMFAFKSLHYGVYFDRCIIWSTAYTIHQSLVSILIIWSMASFLVSCLVAQGGKVNDTALQEVCNIMIRTHYPSLTAPPPRRQSFYLLFSMGLIPGLITSVCHLQTVTNHGHLIFTNVSLIWFTGIKDCNKDDWCCASECSKVAKDNMFCI